MSAQGIEGVLKLTISARPSAKSEAVFRDRVLLRGDEHPSAIALEELFPFSLSFAPALGPQTGYVWFFLVVNVLLLYLEDDIRIIILIQCLWPPNRK